MSHVSCHMYTCNSQILRLQFSIFTVHRSSIFIHLSPLSSLRSSSFSALLIAYCICNNALRTIMSTNQDGKTPKHPQRKRMWGERPSEDDPRPRSEECQSKKKKEDPKPVSREIWGLKKAPDDVRWLPYNDPSFKNHQKRFPTYTEHNPKRFPTYAEHQQYPNFFPLPKGRMVPPVSEDDFFVELTPIPEKTFMLVKTGDALTDNQLNVYRQRYEKEFDDKIEHSSPWSWRWTIMQEDEQRWRKEYYVCWRQSLRTGSYSQYTHLTKEANTFLSLADSTMNKRKRYSRDPLFDVWAYPTSDAPKPPKTP